MLDDLQAAFDKAMAENNDDMVLLLGDAIRRRTAQITADVVPPAAPADEEAPGD